MGRQTPTFEVVGSYEKSDGQACIDTFESYGFTFDDAQKYQLELYLARDEHNKFAAKSVGLSEPRQNGKSHAARFYAIWCAAICGMEVVYSAHKARTVAEFFELLCTIFENPDVYPDFAEMLESAYHHEGAESMSFVGGGRIKFSTRTNSGFRGGTCSILIIDEAQELTDAQLNAILPTLSASKIRDRQTLYIGTPPDPTCVGTVFKRMHDKAHADDPGRDWWLEWSIEELPPENATEKDLLKLAYETNPALGDRIIEEAIIDEISKMTRDGLARERFGWWNKHGQRIDYVIKFNEWTACKTSSPPADGLFTVGVKFAADGSRGSLAVCLKPKEGNPYIELINDRAMNGGVKWFADWIIQRKGKIATVTIDGRAHASALVTRLNELGMPQKAIVTPGSNDITTACSMLVDAVASREVDHYGQPALDASATLTAKRKIGSAGGFGFETTDKGNAEPIEACALALWQAKTTKRRPGRKATVF